MKTMVTPTRTTSMVSPLTLRPDITREKATTHWATTHAEKVKKLPDLLEYNQRLFSASDHSFWPATATVGTAVPEAWRIDGCAEIRFRSALRIANTAIHAREVNLDEQNAFARVLVSPTPPGGGRWWTTGFDDTASAHVALLLRRRQGTRSKAFAAFVHHRLGPALFAAGARDLRTYTFLPYSPLFSGSPGVAHDSPIENRYHGVVLFGVDDRSAVDDLIASAPVAGAVADQDAVLIAVHAYSVERTVPVIRMGSR